jgi:VCBS repeat-containing protein
MSSTTVQTTIIPENVFIESLIKDNNNGEAGEQSLHWTPGSTITYHLRFADFNGDGVSDWNDDYAAEALRLALDQWAAVANIKFEEVSVETGANLVETLYNQNDGNLGRHQYPQLGSTSLGYYNLTQSVFNENGNHQGGYSYVTFVHEIGHGLGLEHPFDTADTDKFPGSGQNNVGDNALNQGIWTLMSYNDGWLEGGQTYNSNFQTTDYGWQASPMAFDIAAIQAIYGANNTYHTGNDTYVMPDVNEVGTGYICIWDAGGTDTISAGDAEAGVIIDLKAATLQNAPGGGGFVSRVTGILGGFTIANGVTIENAAGGSGDDFIYGNDANNRIDGKSGSDTMLGGAGADTFVYSRGNDTITDFVSGTDKLSGSVFFGLKSFAELQDKITGDSSVNTTYTFSDGNTLKLNGVANGAITVNDLANTAPIISFQNGIATSLAVSENKVTVGKIDASDLHNDTLTYSLLGDDRGKFVIDDEGNLKFKSARDYEAPGDLNKDNAYKVTVKVTDGSGASDSQDLTVTVKNVHEKPVISSNGGGSSATITMDENRVTVGTLRATGDSDDKLTWTLSGGDDRGKFTIDADGLLKFKSPRNFETPQDLNGDNAYKVTVKVTDEHGGTDTQSLTVKIRDVSGARAAPEPMADHPVELAIHHDVDHHGWLI